MIGGEGGHCHHAQQHTTLRADASTLLQCMQPLARCEDSIRDVLCALVDAAVPKQIVSGAAKGGREHVLFIVAFRCLCMCVCVCVC